MSKLKQFIVIASLLVVIAACFAFLLHKRSSFLEGARAEKLNVLIVSVCSFRLNSLMHYGRAGGPIAKAIDKFVDESSFVFDRMFNGVSWTSLYGYTWHEVP